MRKGGISLPPICGYLVADQVQVSFGILTLEVVKETSTLADKFQKPAARMMIFGVDLKMLSQAADALTQNRHLHFWRSCISIMGTIRTD